MGTKRSGKAQTQSHGVDHLGHGERSHKVRGKLAAFKAEREVSRREPHLLTDSILRGLDTVLVSLALV